MLRDKSSLPTRTRPYASVRRSIATVVRRVRNVLVNRVDPKIAARFSRRVERKIGLEQDHSLGEERKSGTNSACHRLTVQDAKKVRLRRKESLQSTLRIRDRLPLAVCGMSDELIERYVDS